MSNALFPEFSSPVIMSHTLDDDDDGTDGSAVAWRARFIPSIALTPSAE